MRPQENEDFKGQSEDPTQLSKQIEGSTTEAGSVDKNISTSQLLQNRDGNNSRSNVDYVYTFPVTESIAVLVNTERGICKSQQGVQQNEASMEDKPSSHDPVVIGHNSTEGKSQFPIEGEKIIKSKIMEETRTNQTEQTMFDNKKSQEMLQSQTTENSGVSSPDYVHHEDQEDKKGANSEADTSIHEGHNSTKREPQFPVKGKNALESKMMDEAKTKQTEKTVSNNKNIQETLCS
ncbi:hypothetical protein SUGI_0721080 [Cryptomeria japonica]|nr:hypothetical protein SUGI_0721080 [Cryptomeria japonica]